MKLAIMQPYFFPYIGYFQAISAVDKYILCDNFNYIINGYINRNRYLVVNGKPTYFGIPVRNRSSFLKIHQIQVAIKKNWQDKMLKSIYCNYKKSPYFQQIFPVIEQVLTIKTDFLSVLSAQSIVAISSYLDIKTTIVTASKTYEDLELQLENTALHFPHLKDLDRKTIRIIQMCKRENAKVFINAIGGKALYSKETFAAHNIAVFFIKTEKIHYAQPAAEFYPNLSIIDVLMQCGKERTKELLNNYVLV